MDAASPDRIVIVLIAALCGIAAFAVLFWLGERRDKIRELRDAKIREGERAFKREMMMLHCDAIRSESVARVAAEDARLYRRGSVG